VECSTWIKTFVVLSMYIVLCYKQAENLQQYYSLVQSPSLSFSAWHKKLGEEPAIGRRL